METAKQWPGVIPNEIFKMEQIPTMISYNPGKTIELLNSVDTDYKQFLQSILDLQFVKPEKLKSIIQHLPEMNK